MSLSQRKRASCSIFCYHPPFKRARLHPKFSKMVEPSFAKNSGSARGKEPELSKQSIKETCPSKFDISEGEVVDKSNSVSSSQKNLLKDSNQAKNGQQQFSSTKSSINRKSKKIVAYFYIKKSPSKGRVPRVYGPFKVAVRHKNGWYYLIKGTIQLKPRIKQIQVNSLKTCFERDQPKETVKKCPVQEFNSSTEGYFKIVTDSRIKVLIKTSVEINRN